MDVVYSYVNDRDPEWQAQLAATPFDPSLHNYNSRSPNRFRDREELRYSLRSVARYLPWIRKVFVVVSSLSQVPTWLDKSRVTIVTHRQLGLFSPTFNSHAIEASLHRIPGVSDPFLYFNDDFYVNRYLSPADFVTETGLYRICLLPQCSPVGTPHPREIGHFSAWKNVNTWLNRRSGRSLRYARKHTAHAPVVISPRVMRELWELLPEELRATTSSPFRSIRDYAMTCALHPHYCLETGRAVASPLTCYNVQTAATLEQALTEVREHAFYFINDVKGGKDQPLLQVQELLNPVASPYERTPIVFRTR